MATLSVVTSSRDGVAFAPAAAAGGGDAFANDGKVALYVDNGGANSINVTFATEVTVDGLTLPDRVVAVANGVAKLIGPFPTTTYNDANGLVQVTYSEVTSVTVAPIKVSN